MISSFAIYCSRVHVLEAISIYDIKSVQGAPTSKLPLLEPLITVGSPTYQTSQRSTLQSLYIGSDYAKPLQAVWVIVPLLA